ncbi:MAG: hypothetical protein H0T66_18535 [Geodermatophilaceae bacterium]|nr:hypothetical protein [Geodermatophilaceae bacterium]
MAHVPGWSAGWRILLEVDGRHALVIGSQCEAWAPVSFLPERARDLYEVLTDPVRGGCAPAGSRLVIDPTGAELVACVEEAVGRAANGKAVLVLAFIGHAALVSPPGGGASAVPAAE